MLINELIDFHKTKLSHWNLIFKHFKRKVYFLSAIILVIAIGMISSVIFKSLVYAGICLTIYILLLIYFNIKMKKTILEIHSVDVNKDFKWDAWKIYKVKQIKLLLKKRKMLDSATIRAYQKYVKDEAEEAKPSTYLLLGVPGVLVALGVPVWNHFNSWYFSNIVTDYQDAVIYVIGIVILISLISFILSSIINIVKEFTESKHRRLRELAHLLELVYLSKDELILNENIDRNL